MDTEGPTESGYQVIDDVMEQRTLLVRKTIISCKGFFRCNLFSKSVLRLKQLREQGATDL